MFALLHIATNNKREFAMLRVTFYKKCRHSGKEYTNIEKHASVDDAKLRAYALGWSIVKIENI